MNEYDKLLETPLEFVGIAFSVRNNFQKLLVSMKRFCAIFVKVSTAHERFFKVYTSLWLI